MRWNRGNNKYILITIDERSFSIFWIACFSPLMHKTMTCKFKIKPCMCWQANIESYLNGIMNDFGQESTLKSSWSCTLPFTVFDLLVDMLVKLDLNEFWLRLMKMLSIWLRLCKNRLRLFQIFLDLATSYENVYLLATSL